MNERYSTTSGSPSARSTRRFATWASLLGRPASGRETVESQGVEVVFIGEGPGKVELIAPTHPGSGVARFLERRGPGLHHVAYRVSDLRSALAEARASGFELIDHEPRTGAANHLVAFLHPRSTGGTLIELVEIR
jgi:methylmalonyl-CoA/ethylmalonyl-CoA epimerase